MNKLMNSIWNACNLRKNSFDFRIKTEARSYIIVCDFIQEKKFS